MKLQAFIFLVFTGLILPASAFAGVAHGAAPTSVPVDAPWAIFGLVATVSVIACRMIYNRNK